MDQVDPHALGRVLKDIGRAVADVQRAQIDVLQQQEVMQGTINHVSATSDQTRNDLLSLANRFDAFTMQAQLRHDLQIAHHEIQEVRDELATGYGHFNNVRRLATGTLQALDAGIVSQDSIRQLSEELMLLTPGYWLAPALVALAAWIRDEPDLAFKALNEAVRRDNDKASLFFAMVLRRHHRDQAAARWVRQYVVRQDPAKLSREFMVVLDAVSCGVFGHEAKPLLLAETGRWITDLSDDEDTVDRQVARWQKALDAMRRPIGPRYTILPKISSTWPELRELYEGATVYAVAHKKFEAVFDGPVPLDPDLKQRVDEVLTGLVSNYDIEEAPLRHKEAELQAVIDAEGDKAAAAKAMQVLDPVHETTIDFLTLVSNAALFAEKAGASLGTRRFATSLAKDWIVQATGRIEAVNVASVPAVVEVEIEGWNGRIDSRTDQAALVHGLAGHIDAETEAKVAQIRFTGKPLAAAIGAGVAMVIALVVALSGDPSTGLFFLGVTLALAAWTWHMARGLPARRAELRRQGEQRKAHAVAQLHGGIAELVDLHREWEAEHAACGDLRKYLEGLRSAGFVAAAPDQKRGL